MNITGEAFVSMDLLTFINIVISLFGGVVCVTLIFMLVVITRLGELNKRLSSSTTGKHDKPD